jgi:hypothetical protein
MSSRSVDDAYKLVFAKTGKAKELREHASKTMKKFDNRIHIPEVMVKITSFGKGKDGVIRHLDYISRNGKEKVYDAMDNEIGESRGTQTDKLHEAAQNITALDKSPDKRKRLTCNLMLSMPPNTPKEEFRDSVQDFLAENFSNHEYLYAFHDDTDCYHSHVCIPMKGIDGKRLNPRKNDIAEWRQSFADSLEKNGILANAMTAPSHNRKTFNRDSFKYPDSELVDHGVAPYENNPDNSSSYFVKLKNDKGDEKTLWGADLKNVVQQKEMIIGDKVHFKYKGTVEVDIPIKEKGPNGKEVIKEWRTVDKHEWSGDKAKSKDVTQEPLKERALTRVTQDKVIGAWKMIQRDLEKANDLATAQRITRFCLTRFGRHLETQRGPSEIEDRTR